MINATSKKSLYSDPTKKPPLIAPDFGGVPQELKLAHRWVLWKLESRDGKWTKVPYQPTGKPASSTDEKTWRTFDTVRTAYKKGGFDGIGFVLGDVWAGIDLDDVRDPATGEITVAWAREMIAATGRPADVSPSGTGVKLIGKGKWAAQWHRKPHPSGSGEIEVYDAGRYFTVTGVWLPPQTGGGRVQPTLDIQSTLDSLAALFNTRKAEGPKPPLGAARSPRPDDAELIRKAAAAKNGANFARLWAGDTSDHGGDESRADLALCGALAFWVGPDPARVDGLFRQSGLMRPKWDEPRGETTYGAMTIAKAMAGRTEFHDPTRAGKSARAESRPSSAVSGGQASGERTTAEGSTGDSGDRFRDSIGKWNPPALLPTMPPVPAFPVDLFPAKIADYWRAAAESASLPVDYVAVPALPLLGAAVGRSIAAEVKRTHREPPLLWCGLVSPPGTTKTAALKFAKGPLPLFAKEWAAEFFKRMETYRAAYLKYERDLKEWRKKAAGKPPDEPKQPTLRQAVLDNFTVESLPRVLAVNLRGIGIAKDELSALVDALNQYKSGRGDDKQNLLSMWAGAEITVNRESDRKAGIPPLHIEASFLAVSGMMTPDSLSAFRGDVVRGESNNDGWADRFLLSFPDPPPMTGETWRTVPVALESGYAEVFRELLSWQLEPVLNADGEEISSQPRYVPFDATAVAAWEQFTGDVASRANALDPFDPYRGVLSKSRNHTLRLSALMHALRRACGELPEDAIIDGETVRRASAVMGYFDAHGRRCLGYGWMDHAHRVARRLLDWLSREPERTVFTRTEAYTRLKDAKDVRASERLDPVFRLLVDLDYIRPLTQTGHRPGPVPEAYSVNPLWCRSPP